MDAIIDQETIRNYGRHILSRKASVLQSVCTPEESEVWYFIDTGAVVAVS